MGRRTYLFGGAVYKIVLTDLETTSESRSQSLSGERDILELLSGLAGIPRVYAFRRNDFADILEMEFVGTGSWATQPKQFWSDIAVSAKVLTILFSCSLRGVAHNDLRAENILVDGNRRCFVIDFDQAIRCSPAVAFLANFFGITGKAGVSKVSILKTIAVKLLPEFVTDGLKRAKLKRARQKMRVLPTVGADATSRAKELLEAWRLGQISDANAPGLGIAYYSLDVDGVHFPGERTWTDRWDVLRKVADFNGKRVLELGCNMGLLSTYLLKEGGAAAVLGVDYDADILTSARTVADAFGVHPEFTQVNFDADAGWEERLAQHKPDIVFALNVVNWLSDKERFVRFLVQYPVVIIEGHDDFDTEVARLNAAGPMSCQLLGYSERRRPLMICTKAV
jgi:SAM-dependent methyltransferase